MQFLKNIILHY